MPYSALPRALRALARRRVLAVALVLIAAACTDSPTGRDQAPPLFSTTSADAISIWWPTEGAALTGTHTFKVVLNGYSLRQYRMFWQVDGGQLNRMGDSNTDGPHKEAIVNVDGWTWKGAGPYVVNFVAKDKKGRTIAQRSVSVYVGSAPVAATVEVLAPIGGTELTGVQTFQARVPERAITDYTLHWQVDAGALNAMVTDATGTYKEAPVDVSTWTWNGTGPYTVNFVARDLAGATLAQQSVQVYATQATTAPLPSGNPMAGAVFYVDPYSNARKQADAWRDSRPADAEQMDKVAARSQADWFGNWNSDIFSAADGRTATITSAGALPVFVVYNIPNRDCNGYSSGGANTPDGYRSWIRSFAQGIGTRKAVVILEPDALAQMDCLSATDQQIRMDLIKDAIQVLKAQGQIAVYVDAGHPYWQTAAEMASRLTGAGVEAADGFSLNVSNFYTNADNTAYGEAISAAVGGKHFVIDTSRNGLGSDGTWCNPDGRALGMSATTSTGNALVDAFLWLKRPGESDGSCNGGPSAGSWWADYALGLAQRMPSGVTAMTPVR